MSPDIKGGQVLVTITIDTEEDDWGSYFPTGSGTRNLGKLPELQDVFDRFGARPTYVVTYPTLEAARSVSVLGELALRDEVEIGAHCHPWNTPPFDSRALGVSMMSQLPPAMNAAKLRVLTERITAELGVTPTSFRAGRWGFGSTVAGALVDLGYTVDASVTPLLDWTSSGGPNYSMAPLGPYRFEPDDPLAPSPDGRLVELPSTVAFLGRRHASAGMVRTWLEHNELGRRSRMVGLFDRMGLLSRRWLSPEHTSLDEMVRVSESWIGAGFRILAMTFHSPTLFAGLTPFVRSSADRARFLNRIRDYLQYCSGQGFRFVTLREASMLLDAPASPTSTPSETP